MNRFKRNGLLCMLVAVIFVAAAVESVFAQQSTTGPIPPPGIDPGIRPVTRQQVVIPGVPAYLWHHGCGPTAVGMVIGCWDGKPLIELVPGDASTQTAAVNAMIADDSGNPDCDAADGDHYQDYSCPIDTDSDTALWDKSQTGGAHASNCVADFFKTSWSSEGNQYGWSWFKDADSSWIGYVNWYTDWYKPAARNKYFSEFSWNRYKFEIDRGRPMVLLVDTDSNGVTDHFVTAIGYNDATMEYAIYNTWDTNIHWYKWREIGEGISWGIYGITMCYFERDQIPTLTEWGLIIFGVVLLGFITYVFLKRRKTVVSYQ
jgi:hypothetical protein